MTANMYSVYHKDLDGTTSANHDTAIEIQECDSRSRTRDSESSLSLNTSIITNERSRQDSMCWFEPIRRENDPGRYASRLNGWP